MQTKNQETYLILLTLSLMQTKKIVICDWPVGKKILTQTPAEILGMNFIFLDERVIKIDFKNISPPSIKSLYDRLYTQYKKDQTLSLISSRDKKDVLNFISPPTPASASASLLEDKDISQVKSIKLKLASPLDSSDQEFEINFNISLDVVLSSTSTLCFTVEKTLPFNYALSQGLYFLESCARLNIVSIKPLEQNHNYPSSVQKVHEFLTLSALLGVEKRFDKLCKINNLNSEKIIQKTATQRINQDEAKEVSTLFLTPECTPKGYLNDPQNPSFATKMTFLDISTTSSFVADTFLTGSSRQEIRLVWDKSASRAKSCVFLYDIQQNIQYINFLQAKGKKNLFSLLSKKKQEFFKTKN